MGFEVTQIKTLIANAYLITGEHVALVDTGTGMGYRKLVSVLADRGLTPGDVEFILMTHHHFDHAANLAKIKKLSGATVIAGAEDVGVLEGTEENPPPSDLNRLGRFLGKMPRKLLNSYQAYDRTPVDRKVSGGDLIEELGLEVVAVPGHTKGGMAYLDRQGKRAFIGDMASNYHGKWTMPSISFSHSIEEIFKSQELLAGLDLETAYPGHGVVIQPGASRAIGEFVARQRAKRG